MAEEPGRNGSPALMETEESLLFIHQGLERIDRTVRGALDALARELRRPVTVIVRYADSPQYGDMGELTAQQLEKTKIINARARQIGEAVGGLPGVSHLYGDVL